MSITEENKIILKDEIKIRLNEIENHKIEIKKIEKKIENEIVEVCHGEYIWKITDVMSKIRCKSVIYSNNFYISQFGYKVQLRMIFNSVEEGKISLFLHLCKGEWDNILTWPFKARIKFSILNQNQLGNLFSFSFPTKDGNVFNLRPTSEISKTGFGLSDFISLDNLEQNVHIYDDCMFVKVSFKKKNEEASSIKNEK